MIPRLLVSLLWMFPALVMAESAAAPAAVAPSPEAAVEAQMPKEKPQEALPVTNPVPVSDAKAPPAKAEQLDPNAPAKPNAKPAVPLTPSPEAKPKEAASPVAPAPVPLPKIGETSATAPEAPPLVASVSVVGEARDMAQAITNAMAEGQARAFAQVLQQRDPDRAAGILKKVTPAERAMLVKSVSVQNEVKRAGHYEAQVSYVFDGPKMAALLEESKGLVPELNNSALLVLPAFDDGKALLLFEPQNRWRQLFNRSAMEQGHGRLVVPFGDPHDKLVVDAQSISANSKPVLAEIARRYGAANLVVAIAKFGQADVKTVEVHLRRPGNKPEDDLVEVYRALSAEEKDDSLLKRAADGIAVKLEDGTARFSLFAPPDSMKLKGKVVRAEFRNSRDWMAMRDQLKNLPGVEFSDLGAIASGYAQLTLYYRGDENLIRQTLEGRGLNVTDTGQFWTVKKR